MSRVALHDFSGCQAPASAGRLARPSSVAPRRFLAGFVRNLLRVVVSASVPIDGAQWTDTGNSGAQVGIASADRTARRRKAEVTNERVPVRWANWR